MKFVVGQRYLVTYQVPGLHKKPRQFRATYIGTDKIMDELNFSGRPQFGTAGLELRHMISAIPSEGDCFAPR